MAGAASAAASKIAGAAKGAAEAAGNRGKKKNLLSSRLGSVNENESFTTFLCEDEGTETSSYVRRLRKKQDEKYDIDATT